MVPLRLLLVVLGLFLAFPSDALAIDDDDGGDGTCLVDDHRGPTPGDGPLPLGLPAFPPAPIILPDLPGIATLRSACRGCAGRARSRAATLPPLPRLHRIQHRLGGDSADGDGDRRPR
jgi:hypothetical protein